MVLSAGKGIFSESEWRELINELSLSGRQAQVVRCLFLGHSDKQIARKLQISVPTVRTYLSRLFARFEVQDRLELVLYVLRHFRNGEQENVHHH